MYVQELKWLNIMLHLILKSYYCEWSIIKPNETSRESIHISDKDLILVILQTLGYEWLMLK